MNEKHFEIVVPESLRGLKSLKIKIPHLNNLPENFTTMYPQLETLDLSGNEFGKDAVLRISRLMHDLPNLRQLNISRNPLPPESVITLQFLAKNQEITLISDLSLWKAQHPESPYPELAWALSPKQWVHVTDYVMLMLSVADMVRGDPESLPFFVSLFTQILDLKNQRDRTPILCMVKIPSHTLLEALLQHCGIEWVCERIMNDAEGVDRATLKPEGFIGFFLKNYVLEKYHRLDLAYKLINTLLSHDPALQHEMYAVIAIHQKQPDLAYEHFIQGANLGSPSCHYHCALHLTTSEKTFFAPSRIHRTMYHLAKAFEGGIVSAGHTLGVLYEGRGQMREAYAIYFELHRRFQETPHLLTHLNRADQLDYQSRIFFDADMKKVIAACMEKRSQLTRERCKQLVPEFTSFHHTTVYKSLYDLLGQKTMVAVMESCGYGLLQHYLRDTAIMKDLEKHITKEIGNQTELNRGLRAMDPAEFAQAVAQSTQEFMNSKMGMEVKTKYEQKPIAMKL